MDEKDITPEFIKGTYLNTFLGIRQLTQQLDTFLGSKHQRGRPSISALHNYVYEVALLYIDITGQDFSFVRHLQKSDDDERTKCEPINRAHEFVKLAVNILEIYSEHVQMPVECTDSNIYNACEHAQKRLNSLVLPSSDK